MNSNTRVTLLSAHGQFVVAEQDTRVFANRNDAGEWESFHLTSPHNKFNLNYGDKIHLRSSHGKYLCAEQNSTMIANRDNAGAWEEFTLVDPFNAYNNGPIYPGQQVALRTHHGRYVCAEQNGQLVGNRDAVGEWERFVINYAHNPNVVQFNDIIKITHVQTGNVLHSHRLNYNHGGTSGQQQVTAYHGRNEEDWFRIVGHNNEQGAVPYGVPVNIVHVGTGLFLHSHNGHPSPATGQQEVTCYGGADQNNHWAIKSVDNSYGTLQGGAIVHITHNATGKRLHSHTEKFHLGNGDHQQEVTCHGAHNDANDNWRISEIQNRFKE
jgi:hypothetical protein